MDELPEWVPPWAGRAVAAVDTYAGERWYRRGLYALLALGMGACLTVGSDEPADPTLVPTSAEAACGGATSDVEGFGEVGFRIQPPEGQLPSTSEFCALLADDPASRQQGMMRRTDLGGYDAMIFVFDEDIEGEFWNRDVPIALSIAWFRADGTFVHALDMPPCLDLGEDCPRFGPGAGNAYRYALETPAGGHARLGIAPGSRLELTR